ncbi:hypothetical protein PsYK624_051000 [Phanerochaete sordida]|uniref:Uncharacterized protein n=1 Tax=Phanerochaete sordida TaxID=48140 RepID=A0A9P3G6A1_9APHY|nr:hypothetical protein PsYK624_051000 [Phanerochaete sordida]
MPPVPSLAKRAAPGTPSTASLYVTLPVVVGLTLLLAVCVVLSRRSRRAEQSRVPLNGCIVSASPVSACAGDQADETTPNAPPAAHLRASPARGPAYQDVALDSSVNRGAEPPPYEAEPKPPRYMHGGAA